MNHYKRITLLFFLLLSIISANAQNKLNDYSVVLIPNQFDFQDTPHEYNINKALKETFKKHDFKSFILGEDDIEKSNIDRCDMLTIKIDDKGTFTTKMHINFYNCYNKLIYTSIKGKSLIKQYGPNYQQAIKRALKDINITQHQYIKPKN